MNDPLGLFSIDDPLELFPKSKSKEELDKENTGLMKGVGEKALGVVDAAGQMVAGLPTQILGGLYGLTKFASGQGLDEAANAVHRVEQSNFGLGRGALTPKGAEYTQTAGEIFAKPGEWAGQGAEALGMPSIVGSLPVDVAMNFLPLHGAAKIPGKILNKAEAKFAPPKVDIAEAVKATTADPLGMFGGERAFQDIADSQLNGWQEPVRPTGSGNGLDTVVSQLDQQRAAKAQAVLEQRQAAMQQEVAKQASLDNNAAERGRQANAPTGYAEHVAEQQRLAEQASSEQLARMQREQPMSGELFDHPEQGRIANPYEAFTGDWRIDENGMPIKADLSMDVQNASEPLQRHLWGDELPPMRDPIGQHATLDEAAAQAAQQFGQGGIPLTQAIDSMGWAQRRGAINSQLKGSVEPSGALEGAMAEANSMSHASERGAVDFKEVTEAVKSLYSKVATPLANSLKITPKQPPQDNLLKPISQENIAKKNELALKARVAGLEGSAYERVATREEAIAGINPSKDVSKVGVNKLRSGLEGVLRSNLGNKPLNYARNVFQEARNRAETLSKTHITGKDGIVRQLKELTKDEQGSLVELLQALDKAQKPLTPDLLDTLGFSDKMKKASVAIKDALDVHYAETQKALGEQGLEGFKYREGYVPSNFSGAYTSFVGFIDKDGRFVTKGIAQGDTKFQHDAAIKHYKSMGKEYSEVIGKERKGLNTSTKNSINSYNGFNELVARLGELDPRFAEAKAIVDQHAKDSTHALYRFDVHEIKKAGVKGSLGDRPWLSKAENTKQFLSGLVDYLEEGYRYSSMQKPINEALTLASDPKMLKDMPNTVKILEQYADHIKGQTLNTAGAAGNALLDTATKIVSFNTAGPALPRKVVDIISGTSSRLMMGFGNIGFAAMQLSQAVTGGLPEMLRVRAETGLNPMELGHSATVGGGLHTLALTTADLMGKPELAKGVPTHLQEAWKWAHDKGIFDFSEVALAHELHQSNAALKTLKVVDYSTTAPERATRGPLFMTLADMFHKAGLRGEEALLRAQSATDYAMANYHPDERPSIYSALGETGKLVGALSTFKHNLVEQMVSTTVNAKRQPAAAVAMLTTAYALYGVTGLPGYKEASELVKQLSGKSIREYLMDDPTKSSSIMDGVASHVSQVDIANRVSMSSILPDPTQPLSVAPHISNAVNIIGAAYAYANKQDTASLYDLASKGLPAQGRLMFENKVLTDEYGNVRNSKGDNKLEQPRTIEEQQLRKVAGLRPIRERLQEETLWTQKQRAMKDLQDQKDLEKQYRSAILHGDDTRPILKKYMEAKGDPTRLLNMDLGKVGVDAAKTPKQRAEGELSDSLSSIYKYQYYNGN